MVQTTENAIAYFSKQLNKARINLIKASIVPNRFQEAEGLRNKIGCLELAIAAIKSLEGVDHIEGTQD